MLRVMLSLCLLISNMFSIGVDMPKMQKPKPPRTVIQPLQIAPLTPPKDICIGTNCGQPRPQRAPKVQDPRFIRPKKTPNTRDI
jgi:hypothetical protein